MYHGLLFTHKKEISNWVKNRLAIGYMIFANEFILLALSHKQLSAN